MWARYIVIYVYVCVVLKNPQSYSARIYFIPLQYWFFDSRAYMCLCCVNAKHHLVVADFTDTSNIVLYADAVYASLAV